MGLDVNTIHIWFGFPCVPLACLIRNLLKLNGSQFRDPCWFDPECLLVQSSLYDSQCQREFLLKGGRERSRTVKRARSRCIEEEGRMLADDTRGVYNG